ncbi:MAG: hypothetical protein TECD_00009 [Hyphomicrobiaceae bacterium hypho_1]
MERLILDQIITHIKNRTPVALVTWLTSGRQKIICSGDNLDHDKLRHVVNNGFLTDRSITVRMDEEEVFVNIFNPKLRMIIIGAVHITQELVPLALQACYDVKIIEPRTSFASRERFSKLNCDVRWPDEALSHIDLDERTAFIALTHDTKIDDLALKIALKSNVFYIGALGSKRSHSKRLERLTTSGFSEQDLARINGPIGLDIGAIGPVEIAISILAEVTAVLRGKLRID